MSISNSHRKLLIKLSLITNCIEHLYRLLEQFNFKNEDDRKEINNWLNDIEKTNHELCNLWILNTSDNIDQKLLNEIFNKTKNIDEILIRDNIVYPIEILSISLGVINDLKEFINTKKKKFYSDIIKLEKLNKIEDSFTLINNILNNDIEYTEDYDNGIKHLNVITEILK